MELNVEQIVTMSSVAGVDEAGRGPLAGPVVAGAVILNPNRSIEGLMDSKLLSEKRREQLFDVIAEQACAYAIGIASVEEIDSINILQASMLAMQRAVEGLVVCPTRVFVDGNRCPDVAMQVDAIVKGDQKVPCIAAASIMAKVTRDRMMLEYAELYPQYAFEQHKGYGTKQHMALLQENGPCKIHRQSFAPVKKCARQVV